MIASYRFLLMASLVVFSSDLVHAQPRIECVLKPEKSVCAPGEPIVMNLRLKNRGNEKTLLYVGEDGVGAFTFEIRDNQGNVVVPASRARGAAKGISTKSSYAEVTDGGVADFRLVLNRWCSTSLPMGQYLVVCSMKSDLIAPLESRAAVTIDETNIPELDALLMRIWDMSLHDKLAENRALAREMLCWCQTPRSARYKMAIVLSEHLMGESTSAIEGLVSIGDLQAARYLVALAEDESLPTQVRRETVEALYRIREMTNNQAILHATVDAVTKFERPKQRMAGD